jgi:quinoprotein glucose dehydrogenase
VVSKQAFCYVFDRVTGKPIWPIEERPVPQSTVPGEKTSPTQPFLTKPAPFDRQGVTENDVVDFTPELHEQALAILKTYNYGPVFTPPSLEKPAIYMPGIAGGVSWSGAAFDPETGILYVSSVTLPYAATLVESSVPNTGHVGNMAQVKTMQGVPLWKPPYGRITAIDLDSRPQPVRLRQVDRRGSWGSGVATQRDRSADDLQAERQAIHRRPNRGRRSACGTHRVVPTMTLLHYALG